MGMKAILVFGSVAYASKGKSVPMLTDEQVNKIKFDCPGYQGVPCKGNGYLSKVENITDSSDSGTECDICLKDGIEETWRCCSFDGNCQFGVCKNCMKKYGREDGTLASEDMERDRASRLGKN